MATFESGGSTGTRRPTPITYDNPPGSLCSPVPLQRGTDPTTGQHTSKESKSSSPPFKGDGRGAKRRGRGIDSVPKTCADHVRQSPWLTPFARPPSKGGPIPRQASTRARSQSPSVPLSRGTAEERSGEAGGSTVSRRPALITYDNPLGSLRSPVPLQRGDRSHDRPAHEQGVKVLRSPFQGGRPRSEAARQGDRQCPEDLR